MRTTPWQSLMADTEVMDEIQELLVSRKKFPRLEAAPGSRKAVGEYLELSLSGAELPQSTHDLITEAIVLSVGRPSLLIQGGKFEEPQLEIWKRRLDPARDSIQKVIPSVGRVEVFHHPDFEWLGTAWVIDEKVLVTNRHVAEEFAERRGGRFSFRRNFFGESMEARIDFLEEFQATENFELNIEEILFIAPSGSLHPDIALLRVSDSAELPAPIPLADRDPEEGQPIGIIGYPARDSRNGASDLVRIFHDIFDVKRLAPGFVTSRAPGHVFQHDGSTLGGNSGSPVIDLATGAAVGLHFGGRFRVANFAVNGSTIKETLVRRNRVGLSRGVVHVEEALSSADYSDRKGYCEDFLGNEAGVLVPLPDLSTNLRSDAVRVNGHRGISAFALDYTHFSVIMSKSHKLAFYTAVNIDGNQEVSLRRRRTPWKIDPRIPREFQTGNELYRDNRLDRGHLVRRLDPVWGPAETARQADDDSFHYTNAAPQHERLNQQTWLALEDYLLENTNARDLKISVFTGPIFSESDPVYRGVAIPQEFWKVVAMVNPQGRLHATAYILSQSRFLDDIEFVFGSYRTYQVPIAVVEEQTGIRFGELSKFDPIGEIESVGLHVIEGPEDLIL